MTPNDSNAKAEAERERLFVGIALKNELVNQEQIQEAREIQQRIAELGIKPKSVGDILLEKGFIAAADFEKINTHIAKLQRSVLIKGYKLMKKLGGGSMGTVYMARQLSLDRIVAVKILAPFLQRNTKFVSRFIKEAKVLARLNHPNIVQCIDVGVSDGQYYLAMEYCDGPTVLELIRRGGKLAEERAVRIIVQMVRALEHAYEHAILHRDIKPDNIMIVQNGTAKLCDLGLVKDLGSGGDTTDSGSTLGTPNYISPEQARGDEEIDVRSDIYSLGATFYHMVTGHTPFENANPAVVMVSHINEMPAPPRERCPELSSETSRIIMRMLRKNPSDRYQTPGELRKELERHLEQLSEGSGDPALKLKSRRRR